MYSAVVSILVRSFLFNRVQQSLGLMRTASVGCAMQTVCFAGYSLLPKVEPGGSVIGPSLYVYVAFSTLSAIGSAFSAAAVTPFFSQLANRSNMGRVMSIASMMNSAGQRAWAERRLHCPHRPDCCLGCAIRSRRRPALVWHALCPQRSGSVPGGGNVCVRWGRGVLLRAGPPHESDAACEASGRRRLS